MQQWNDNFSNRHRNEYSQENKDVTNRQADYERLREFNRQADEYNPDNYYQREVNDGMNRRHLENEHFRYQAQQNMDFYRPTEHTDQQWNNLVNWADNMQQNQHNNQNNFNNNNNFGGGFGEAYNPENRNYHPTFADDEAGFTGGYGND
ncbi:MAG: hypothetical protein EOP53_16955, partial [Sphingobacteriales bacterium]